MRKEKPKECKTFACIAVKQKCLHRNKKSEADKHHTIPHFHRKRLQLIALSTGIPPIHGIKTILMQRTNNAALYIHPALAKLSAGVRAGSRKCKDTRFSSKHTKPLAGYFQLSDLIIAKAA